jgi:hypothetical protein
VAIVAVAILGGTLTGCGRSLPADSQAPAAGVTAGTTAPAPASGSNNDSLESIQGDLDSANSATTNAGGDVADADSSAATGDSP